MHASPTCTKDDQGCRYGQAPLNGRLCLRSRTVRRRFRAKDHPVTIAHQRSLPVLFASRQVAHARQGVLGCGVHVPLMQCRKHCSVTTCRRACVQAAAQSEDVHRGTLKLIYVKLIGCWSAQSKAVCCTNSHGIFAAITWSLFAASRPRCMIGTSEMRERSRLVSARAVVGARSEGLSIQQDLANRHAHPSPYGSAAAASTCTSCIGQTHYAADAPRESTPLPVTRRYCRQYCPAGPIPSLGSQTARAPRPCSWQNLVH